MSTIDTPIEAVTNSNAFGTSPEYLTPTQAAELTGFTLRALECMRAKRTGPAYIKVGTSRNSVIRYRLSDIHAWMQAHREVTDEQ